VRRGESVSDWELRDLWDETEFELGKVRLLGDLVTAAWFEAETPKEREAKRLEFANAVASGEAEQFRDWLEERRHAGSPLAPFHWDLEFPEVFGRKNSGFDSIVGNPPFLGGNRISELFQGPEYGHWLKTHVSDAMGQVDLCAFFFCRLYTLLRAGGTLGLVATASVAAGDSRVAGLSRILSDGGRIYSGGRGQDVLRIPRGAHGPQRRRG
jgi:hypothetical protein